MSSASIKKIIPCKKEQLVKMILDIEKYPEFVPWCIEGKVYDKNESSERIPRIPIDFSGLLPQKSTLLPRLIGKGVRLPENTVSEGISGLCVRM